MKEDSKKQIYNEASIMKKLMHPNVISFKEVFKDTKLDYFYIVMEYANDGDLSKKIKTQNQKNYGEKYFSEEKILQYFYQICRGLQYIHSKNIIHRDIKSQNIFLMKNGKIKIGDFGIAKALTNTKNNATTIIGTPYYFSPEIINGEPYDYKTDIWSLGVVLYEMCCLKLPFEANNIAQLSIKIMKGNFAPIPSKYSKNMSDLIKRMLNIDKKLRPDISEVMQSSLMKNYQINKNSNKSCKNWSSNKKSINSIQSELNFKINEQMSNQKERERKSAINNRKINNKSQTPIKFKNQSYVGKAVLINKSKENNDFSFDLPKDAKNNKTKKSNIFKRISTQKNVVINANINKEIETIKTNIDNIDNKINKKNLYINNIIAKSVNNFANIKNKNIIDMNNKKSNIKSTNNFNNNNIKIDNINKYLNVNKSHNNNINRNLFYNINSSNKEDIINRSIDFDINFSGRSILFDKEKTLQLQNENEEKENEQEKINKNLVSIKEDVKTHKEINKSLYNFNFSEKSIKMSTLKEEEEEETIKSNCTLYNGDTAELNFDRKTNILERKVNESKEIKDNKKNYDESNADLDFEIINNSMNETNKENKIKKKNQFNLEEYIKKQIGEKMYLIIHKYLIDYNIDKIVNYSYDKLINQIREVLKKNEFREREIKKAEIYLFDIFFNNINKDKF